jgi:hypothetical protein
MVSLERATLGALLRSSGLATRRRLPDAGTVEVEVEEMAMMVEYQLA